MESHKFNKFKIKKIISLFIFLSSVNGKLALKLNKKFTDIFKGNTGLLLVAEIQKMSNDLSIILPTLNEGKNLEKLIPQIFEILNNKNIVNNEILVIDDGSTDGTEEMCQSLNNRYGNIRFIRRNNEPSLPLAIYEGIESTKFQNVAWMDADGSMPADTLGILVEDFFKNMDNIVIGSRFC